MTRALLVPRSGNKKTGPIPVSITGRETCPDACPLKGAGCYAEGWPLVKAWDRVTEGGGRATDWAGFCVKVAALPAGQLWRHNQAGDLPGKGNRIAPRMLADLVEANRGKRGFTYTHKPPTAANLRAIRAANAGGFTCNMSANNVAEADTLARTGAGPVVVLLPADAPARMRTPEGRHVVLCPAQAREGMTCARCKLCAVPTRKAIIGFRAHGAAIRMADRVALNVIK